MMKVMVFAVYFDDEIIGVGGMFVKYVCQGDSVLVVIMVEGKLLRKIDYEKLEEFVMEYFY